MLTKVDGFFLYRPHVRVLALVVGRVITNSSAKCQLLVFLMLLQFNKEAPTRRHSMVEMDSKNFSTYANPQPIQEQLS